VLLTGPSGSGKSTLLKALAGVLSSTEVGEQNGSIVVDGVDARTEAAVGLLLQEPSDAMVAESVTRDVAFGLENRSLSPSLMPEMIAKALRETGISHVDGGRTNELSGGEMQRVALAGVVAMDHGLLLLDEPTSMLDSQAAAQVREGIVNTARSAGATVVLVEHDVTDWLEHVDRILVLSPDGKLVADGATHSVLVDHAELLDDLGTWLPRKSAPVPAEVSLESVHSRLVEESNQPSVELRGVTIERVASPLNVTTSTSSSSGRVVFRDVNLSFYPGQITAVVGASGVGKSTLVSAILGLVPISSGQIIFETGLGLPSMSPRRLRPKEISRLGQKLGWVPQNAQRILESKYAQKLSGGESRRAAVERALEHQPAVLVMDEPTIGQDRNSWKDVVGRLVAARNAGTTVIVATHDPALIQLADRVIDVGLLAETNESSFAERPSSAHSSGRSRIGPLAVLAASALLLVGSFAVTTLMAAAVGVALEAVALAVASIWIRFTWRRLIPGVIAVLSIAISTWLLNSTHSPVIAATAGLRVAFFVLPGVVLASTINPSKLGDHLAGRLRLPDNAVVAAVAAFQQFERMVISWRELRFIAAFRTGQLQSGKRSSSLSRSAAVAIAMVSEAFQIASRMSVAMESRGYRPHLDRAQPRTWMFGAPWLTSDTILLVVTAAIAAVPLLIRLSSG